MTLLTVRIKVRCVSCRTSLRLNQEQYHELVKCSRVALVCPHCASHFEYTPIIPCTGDELRARSEAKRESLPQPSSPSAAIPEAFPVAVPDFPPPPFAPLTVGAPANHATPPPFAPLAGMPSSPSPTASFPQTPSAPTGNDGKKLTLNERWKMLPPWVQWTVMGVVVALLGVVIFAL